MNDRQIKAAIALLAIGSVAAPEDFGWAKLKELARDYVDRDPMDSAAMAVLVGAYLFYQAEKDENPKVKTYADAMMFVSTCLSVGYSDVFARTEAGKVIASVIMTYGPPIASNSLGAPRKPDAP